MTEGELQRRIRKTMKAHSMNAKILVFGILMLDDITEAKKELEEHFKNRPTWKEKDPLRFIPASHSMSMENWIRKLEKIIKK